MKSIRWYILPLIAAALLFGTLGDILLYGGSIFSDKILAYAGENKDSLSVVLSGLLLIAYLLQFQSQIAQRKIMNRQEQIMKAGYTPILGVTNQRFGQDEYEGPDISSHKANELFLDLVNNGNSTARDLQVWFGISYSACSWKTPDIRSNSVPLRRAKDGAWWPAETGGAITDDSEDSVTFSCEPMLSKFERTIPFVPIFGSRKDLEMGEALELLKKEGVKEFRLAIVLRYTTATGVKDNIPLSAYKANPGTIGDDYLLYKASEVNAKVEEYKEAARD
ncbi:hypothetical protein ACFQJC_15045 [Haloferax namakaokahaiae]|uniref:Uncharacterized protein n=1 Tax=Haloferax namakaokahaiae TaxID=1748331 RepID=A0ABD5ZI09_9EURY